QVSLTSTVSDPGNEDLTYAWSVWTEDGQFTLPNGTDTSHDTFNFTPPDEGSYTVRLTVSDGITDTTAVSDPIQVNDVAPSGSTISGAPTDPTNEGDAIALSANPVDAGVNDTFTYSWSVKKDGSAYDLGSADTASQNFSFTPNDNGSYVATVRVTDNSG